MNPLIALPLRTVALQYRALRLPYIVFEQQFVGRLRDTSSLRLGYERAVGQLDATVGRLTGDRELAERGAALQRRVHVLRTRGAVLEKADRLESKAQARRGEAEQALQVERERAEQALAEAHQAAADGVQAALAQEEADKRRIAADADAEERVAKERAEAEADRRAQAAAERLHAEQQRIAGQEQAATAAPEAQLDDAVQLAAAAEQRKDHADRMGELADVEASSRHTVGSTQQ